MAKELSCYAVVSSAWTMQLAAFSFS